MTEGGLESWQQPATGVSGRFVGGRLARHLCARSLQVDTHARRRPKQSDTHDGDDDGRPSFALHLLTSLPFLVASRTRASVALLSIILAPLILPFALPNKRLLIFTLARPPCRRLPFCRPDGSPSGINRPAETST